MKYEVKLPRFPCHAVSDQLINYLAACSIMAAEGGNDIVWFTYTGEEDIPRQATHVFVDVKIIRYGAFDRHQNIVEVICDDKVEKIERQAFGRCPSLRRVIMRGVKIVEELAFLGCFALEYVACGKLETIGGYAFNDCYSLRSINLPSAEIVEEAAFLGCEALTDAKFGSKLERFDQRAFDICTSLERITVPLKDGIITNNDIFMGCINLEHAELVEGALHETIAALYFEDWRNDMREEMESINRILPDTDAGSEWDDVGWNDDDDVGEKALVIRMWIRSVLDKILHYKVEHERVLDEAAATIELALPRDIAMNNVLSFLTLPPYTFGV